MNRQVTQFAVALLGIFFLGAGTLAAIVGEVFYDSSSELTFALVTALTGVTGAATAYLFRLNGATGGP
jgi:hypothetical protein